MVSEKKPFRPKAVLFDLDGTLLDTLEDLGNAVNGVLARKGFPTHRLDAFRYFIGDGLTMLFSRALPQGRRDDDTIRTCIKAFNEDYSRNWNIKTKAYDGVSEMLDALTARGLKMAVLSNKPDDFAKQCVTGLLPNWPFDVVIGQRDGVPPKPDPAGALEIARRLNTAPTDFLYPGDSAVDMKTAVAARMFPVGVLWGFRSAEELRTGGARVLIKHPMEILDFLS